jgi:uncharacterized membrane protein YhaH (DUF805 family)
MTDSNKPDSTSNQSIENIVGERMVLFNGRYGRRKFWLWSLLLPPLLMLTLFPLVSMSDPRGSAGGVFALFVIAMPFLFLYSKLIAHRLHDIGWSAWWTLMFVLLPIFMFRESDAIYDRIEQSYEAQQWFKPYVAFMTFGSLAIFFGGFIVMGCLLGTKGPNQYGPDPLADAIDKTKPPA